MNDELLKEQVSALADDELDRDERKLLLRRMAADPALRERWTRYFLIRDSLRDSLPASIDRDFAGTVSARISGEPQGAAAVRFTPAIRRVAGIAVAASVATVALLTLQVDRPMGEPAPESATVVPVTQAPRVPPVRFATTPAPSWDSARPEVQVQLNQLLLTHSDAAEATPAPDEPAGDDGDDR